MKKELLRDLGFDLAYLALLTAQGIKPLSRWERDFRSNTIPLLTQLGLRSRVVERVVASGSTVHELIFSRTACVLDAYVSRFQRQPIRRSAAAIQAEGLLFGYPSCCVTSYAAHGYARSRLRRRDQRLLFHWACPDCAITPLLVPSYRTIHQRCRQAVEPGASLRPLAQTGLAVATSGRAVSWATALAMMAGAFSQARPDGAGDDPHRLPLEIWEDPDGDLLTSAEEQILQFDSSRSDEDNNAVADGTDLALTCSAILDALPTDPSGTQPYLVHNQMRGLENCRVCGEAVNMGYLEVIHPVENAAVTIPYVAKHYLEHGSFSYAGDLHEGRISPTQLNLLLTGNGLGHFLSEPIGTDGDNDGLRDWEEASFHTDPNRRDTDEDGVADGAAEAHLLLDELQGLPRASGPDQGPKDRPFIVEHPMDGVEMCPQCGDQIVMDIWDVIHPVTGHSIRVSSMALHFLRHGGFRWKGGQLLGGGGRVDPRHLLAVLRGEGNGHRLHVARDTDQDLLTDREEEDLRSDSRNPDEDHNQLVDGIDLAKELAEEVAALPRESSQDKVFCEEYALRGLERCDICGEEVNMGHMVIVNPQAGLFAYLPYIGLHYLKHGSFSHAGDVHGEGRVDPYLLAETLHSAGPSHLSVVPDDTDSDGAPDQLEKRFHLNPTALDTDTDGVPDGFDLARDLWRTIASLPSGPDANGYRVEHLMRGVVACEICGRSINMGYVEVLVPRRGFSTYISYLTLHYLQHGSLAILSEQDFDPLALQAALRPFVLMSATEERISLRWTGEKGRRYQLLSASSLDGPWTDRAAFEGDGSELSYEESPQPGNPPQFFKLVAW